MKQKHKEFLHKPVVGDTLAVSAGLAFFFTCLLLPLVGRAGASVPHAGWNQLAFLSMLIFTLALSGAALYVKLIRRAADGSKRPYWSIGLCIACTLLLILQLTGLLAI